MKAGVGAGVDATAKDQIAPGMISATVFDTQAAPDVVQTRAKVTQMLVTVDTSGKSLINKNDPVATKPIETPLYQSTTSIPTYVVSTTDTPTTVSSVETTNVVSPVDTVNVVSSVGTKNVAPTVEASVSSSMATGQSLVSSYVDTGPSQRELQMIARERKAQNDIQELIRQQREELRRLEDQKREHQRQLMLEKQRVEYEKQQLSLRKQQMEIEALRKEQLYQRQLMEAQRKQMQADRLKMEQDRLAAIELAKKKAAEEERLRLEKERLKAEQERQRQAEIAFQRVQQERMMQLEFQKQQEIELARQQAIAEENKRLEQEQQRKAEIAKQKALEAEKRRLEEERKKQAAADEARMLAEIQAAMIAEEKAIAERAAADKAAREKAAAEKAAAEKAAAEKAKKAAPKNMTSTDAAWQAVLAAAGVTGSQHTDIAALMGGSGAAGMGMDPAALLKFLNPPSTPAPIITTPKPRKIPIRPDPKTRREVRQIFLDNMKPGVDPLSILIGLTPEKLMRSGVNPVIANSADLARIVPATERALGIQIKMLPTPGMRGSHPRGAVGHPSAMRGGAGLGGLPPPTSGSSRRQFMIEQRMMNEMMQVQSPWNQVIQASRGPGRPQVDLGVRLLDPGVQAVQGSGVHGELTHLK
ncbi:uncharacterized protein LOC128240433 [Mya arenaria]|uniref:uncharacterized protein LOC128240433 n=1 Tax=Mya arenaria TaxID=6604 RepID=UPI0022E2E4D2|nr:uncharacterized protein LOC128240433 [Mya arenaria]